MAGKNGLDGLIWKIDKMGRAFFSDGESTTQTAGPAYVTHAEKIERQQAQRKADADARRVQREEEKTATIHDHYVGFMNRRQRPGSEGIFQSVADYSQTLTPDEQAKFVKDPGAINAMYDRIEAGEDPFSPAEAKPSDAQVYEDFRREHGLEPTEPQTQGPDIEAIRERIADGDKNAEVELASTIDLTYKGVE